MTEIDICWHNGESTGPGAGAGERTEVKDETQHHSV